MWGFGVGTDQVCELIVCHGQVGPCGAASTRVASHPCSVQDILAPQLLGASDQVGHMLLPGRRHMLLCFLGDKLQAHAAFPGFEHAGFANSGFRDAGFGDAAFGNAGFPDAGFRDAIFMDAGFRDAGFENARFWDAGFWDAGFGNAGFMNAGFGVQGAG